MRRAAGVSKMPRVREIWKLESRQRREKSGRSECEIEREIEMG